MVRSVRFFFSKTSVGVEPTGMPLCRRPPHRLAPTSTVFFSTTQILLSKTVSSPGIEPGLRPSQGRVRIRHTPRTHSSQCLTEESNLVWQLRTLPCYPSHSQGMSSIPTWNRTRTWTFGGSNAIRYTIGTTITTRADDWIRASMNRFTRPVPFCFEPRRQSFEQERRESNPIGRFWRPLALPGAHSSIGVDSGPTQACPCLGRALANIVTPFPTSRSSTPR